MAGCPPDPDFRLSLAPAALTIVRGASGTATVAIDRNDFTRSVTLSLDGMPAGVTGVFNPAAPTGTTSTLTVSVGAAVTPGTYNLTVDGDGTPGNRSTPLTLTVAAVPDYALSLTPTAFTIVQGTTGNTAVTITRTNFTDAVTLSLSGAPAGVTGSFNPAAPTGTSSALTVSVGAAVAPGVYNLTVDGTGTPGNRSTPLTLTVSAAPNYALSLTPASLTIVQGATANTAVTVTRTNFIGAVTLSLGGASAGVTGSFNPATPTGTSSALTVSVGPAVAPGVYNLTVDGTGSPGNRSTPLTLTVQPAGGGGSITVDFSACAAAERPVWLASQDGTGPWSVVTGASNVYRFSITSGKGGLAYVLKPSVSTFSIQVHYRTQSEFTAGTLIFCPPPGKTVSGTVAGFFGADHFLISLGGGSTQLQSFFTDPNFQISGVKSGIHDLVGYRQGGSPQSVIIRRDLDIADGGSVGTMNFSGPEAFAPASNTITVGGLFGGETVSQSMFYQVGASCETAPLFAFAQAGPAFTVFGIPAAQQRASDYHGVSFTAATATASRSITEYFHTLGVRTVTLGAAMPRPVLARLSAPYARLQAVYTLPADYSTSTSFLYRGRDVNFADRFVSLTATFGYLGASATALALPDYSTLPGWDNNWAPEVGSNVEWTVTGSGRSITGSVCAEGARVVSASANGNF